MDSWASFLELPQVGRPDAGLAPGHGLAEIQPSCPQPVAKLLLPGFVKFPAGHEQKSH